MYTLSLYKWYVPFCFIWQCSSINETICHGIPDARELQEGDICNVDISVYWHDGQEGYHGDLNETFFVGKVSEEARRLVQTTYECLEKAIEMVKPRTLYRQVGHAIQKHASAAGFSVVKAYCGHGVGMYVVRGCSLLCSLLCVSMLHSCSYYDCTMYFVYICMMCIFV